MIRYRATILILFIFVIDCVTGNLANNPDVSSSSAWWYSFAVPYLTGKSFFIWLPYLTVIFWAVTQYYKYKIQFEFPDLLMAIVALFSCVINSFDWVFNGNTRTEKLDWWAFAIIIFLLFILKLSWKKVLSYIGRTRI